MYYSCPFSCPQTRDLLQPLLITPGKDFNSRFGNYRHNDFIGVPYGSKVGAPSGKGFIHLLRPTPELWTTALPHRTQILYLADIAFITSQLNIRRGSRVIEAGKPRLVTQPILPFSLLQVRVLIESPERNWLSIILPLRYTLRWFCRPSLVIRVPRGQGC